MKDDVITLAAFTLLELLIVVGIIGILASLIIIAVGGAKQRALDSSIKANLSQVRQEAASLQAESNSYTGLCSGGTLNEGNPNLALVEQEVMKRNGQQNVVCYADATSYCVQSPLASGGEFCIDVEGRASTTQTNCSGANIRCP